MHKKHLSTLVTLAVLGFVGAIYFANPVYADIPCGGYNQPACTTANGAKTPGTTGSSAVVNNTSTQTSSSSTAKTTSPVSDTAATAAGAGKKCIWYTWDSDKDGATDKQTTHICTRVDAEDKVVSAKPFLENSKTPPYVLIENDKVTISDVDLSINAGCANYSNPTACVGGTRVANARKVSFTVTKGQAWSDVVNGANSAGQGMANWVNNDTNTTHNLDMSSRTYPGFSLCLTGQSECSAYVAAGTTYEEAIAAGTEARASTDSQTSQEDGCFRNGGATGWILCPVVNGASQLVETIYDTQVEPLLQVNNNVIDDLSNPDGGTYSAWSIFRDFANIAFVILLLVVILSQVTGYGIDNYGIKRILPKLVVTAIMVNLSFLLCRVAVDLSNIFGMSLRNLMEGIANNIPQPNATFSGDSNLAGVNVLTAAVAALASGAGALTAISAVMSSGWGVLLPLLLAGLSALIAVFFAFLILGIRQALVILLTVISPLAFVAYALPNTNNLFKKWFDALKGVLLVYPICGLLVGGGDLAARILLSGSGGDDFGTLIIAIVVSFAPYFFIPSLLKSSLAALGGLSDKISSLSRATRRGATGRLRESDAYKRAQTRLSRPHRNIFRKNPTGTWRNRLASTGFARAMGWQASAARANQAAIRQADEDRQATAQLHAVMKPNESASSLVGAGFERSGKAFEQAIDDAMYNDSVHAVDAVADELDKMTVFDNSAKGRANVAKLQALQARARNDSNFASLMKNRNRDAFDMIMDGGASGQQLSHYSAALREKMADGDWATQKAGTLKRAAAAGGLTSEIAQHLATSEDESLRGLQTDPGTRDVIQAVANEGENAQAAFQAVSGMSDGGQSAINASASDYRTQRAAEHDATELKIQHDQATANQRARYEGMSDDEVLDIATSPNASMTEQKQAEVEYRRRTEGGGTPTPPNP